MRWQPALGLVESVVVLPHYDAVPEAFSACIALQAPRGAIVFGIDEDTAAVGRNGAWQVHGAGRVTVWRGRRRERFRRAEAFRA
jgi:cyanophycinase-like exopeptidase